MERQPWFVVAIPARDEELLIERSIAAVLAAADELDDPGSFHLVIACDSCVDTTVDRALRIARGDRRVDVIEGRWANAGASRAAAIRRAMRVARSRLKTLDPLSHAWVATTDADTVVPTDWLTTQALCWAAGDHAVAGVVDLLDDGAPGGCASDALFERHYVLGHDSHGHVHGANLGIRADAYQRVGGFPPIALAEDHALWNALRRAGYRCRSSVALRVTTSARLHGRAAGGFADTLRSLVADDGVSTGRSDAVATA